MRKIRIFVSSPADVEFERQRVDRVAGRLNGVFMDIARFETFRWEKGFYSAHQSYQPQIDEAQKLADCDIVVAVFWSRIGSPLAARDGRKRGGFDCHQRANLLLLVDQLENIFGSGVTDDQRSAFARILFSLSSTRRIWVVSTLRSDLYHRMITPGGFITLKDAGADFDLAKPGEAELIEIVHKSGTATGLVYESNPQSGERLEDRILKDAKGENALPLLEFTLDRLFKDRSIVDGETRLTFAAYEAMGGLDGAIDQTAEHAVRQFGKRELAALPRLLRMLAAPVHDRRAGPAGGGELTARPMPVHEVVHDTATSALVNALIDARIIVVTGDAKNGGALMGRCPSACVRGLEGGAADC